MKKVFGLLLILISSIVVGCEVDDSPEIESEEKVELPEVIEECKDCVYSIYYEEDEKVLPGTKPRYHTYDETYDVLTNKNYTLTEYEKDYRKLIKGRAEDKRYFLGHILNKDGKIERAFACGVHNDEPFCIEGRLDNSAFESNKNRLIEVFGEWICKDNGLDFYCDADDIQVSMSLDGGGVSTGDAYKRSAKWCTVYNDGYIYCD